MSDEPPSDWIQLTREEAERHPLHGVGGWLLLPLGWICVLALGHAVAGLLLAYYGFSPWASVLRHRPEGDALRMLFLLGIALCWAWAYFAVMLVRRCRAKDPTFPDRAVRLMAAFGAVQFYFAVLAGIFDKRAGWDAFQLSFIAAVLAGVALVYFEDSKRVNVTFRARLPRS
jgi:hypothetical protein